jgi:hypothetical protein
VSDPLLEATAQNILNRMMAGANFYITDVDRAAELIGAQKAGATYERLRRLHCVSWSDMPDELRDQIPNMIREVLAVPAFQFRFATRPPLGVVVDIEPQQQPRGTWARLIGKG